MDEKMFMDKWIAASRDLRCEVGDVRQGVWARIAEEENAAPLSPATIFKLDVAAALVISVGSGALYFMVNEFANAAFWSAQLQYFMGVYY